MLILSATVWRYLKRLLIISKRAVSQLRFHLMDWVRLMIVSVHCAAVRVPVSMYCARLTGCWRTRLNLLFLSRSRVATSMDYLILCVIFWSVICHFLSITTGITIFLTASRIYDLRMIRLLLGCAPFLL